MADVGVRRGGYVGAALVLGLCVVIAAAVFGEFHYRSRARTKTISVVGSATKRFVADVVKWRMGVNVQVGLNELQQGYERLKRNVDGLMKFLAANGLDASAVVKKPVSSRYAYDREGRPTAYVVSQSLFLTSKDIEKVEKLALDPSALFEAGIALEYSTLEYYNSKIADLKRELLSEATLDARRRAESIAKSSGLEIGALISARQGVFQITEPYSTEVSDYGVYSTATREKEIRVTVRATFEVK